MIAEHFGIGGFLKQSCGTYSSGMTKRLSLAIAFLGAPKVIILDEPFITLDTEIRDSLTSLIKNMIPEEKTVFLISSHELLTHMFLPIARSLVITHQNIRVE
jgi:ABC-2 type transport system ATP-binding protein